MTASESPLRVDWLGSVPYGEALELQREALEARIAREQGDRLLLLEHPPVITLGRSARNENLLVPPDELARRGIELHRVARGGDVTYHAPGQLVGYPIIDLKARGTPDVHAYLRTLELGLIEAAKTMGVAARRVEGRTGVFIDSARTSDPSADPNAAPDRKLASIGVGLRRWVTQHGFALNVTLDLAGFEAIVPCGLSDVAMTSLAVELESPTDAHDVLMVRTRDVVASVFQRLFA